MKCNYCDFVWEDEEEYGKHLNATHTKCFHCSTVFNNDEFDDDYAICGKCREKKNEDQIAKEIAKMSDGEVVQNVEKYFPKWTATESMKRMLIKYGHLDEQVYFLEILRLESLCRRAVSEALDIVAFEKGFRDGIEDYEDSLKEFGDGAATTAGWEE